MLLLGLDQPIPIGSMYGVFAYIYHKKQPNLGKYIPYMDPMRYAIRFGVLEDGLDYACENFALFESAFRYVLRLRDYPPTSFPIRFGWDWKPQKPTNRDF